MMPVAYLRGAVPFKFKELLLGKVGFSLRDAPTNDDGRFTRQSGVKCCTYYSVSHLTATVHLAPQQVDCRVHVNRLCCIERTQHVKVRIWGVRVICLGQVRRLIFSSLT